MNHPRAFTERRIYPRFPVNLPIDYWKKDDIRPRAGLAGNISEMGLLVLSNHKMATGTELRITLLFPKGYELTNFDVFVKIIWKDLHFESEWKGYKYGVKFTGMSEKDRIKLDRFISAHLSAHLSMNESPDDKQAA